MILSYSYNSPFLLSSEMVTKLEYMKKYTLIIHKIANSNPKRCSQKIGNVAKPLLGIYPSHMLDVVEWGLISMCDAESRLLVNALLDMSNEWFFLVSESRIPIQNLTTIFTKGCYNKKMAPEINHTKGHKGSQWFEVNLKLVINITEDSTYYSRKFCRPTFYVDEHYFPRMLTIQSPDLLANTSLTWVENSSSSYNDQTHSLCFLFARKFAPSALDSLSALA
ncbi:hypothetical protein ACJRO7_005670 [Eucalyptus globulus]|uniref:Uncharacterized protein n=1 Tax=Eucalyptus globulus TaxID=34317 RepID=A0ABD3J2Q8_EUCGL